MCSKVAREPDAGRCPCCWLGLLGRRRPGSSLQACREACPPHPGHPGSLRRGVSTPHVPRRHIPLGSPANGASTHLTSFSGNALKMEKPYKELLPDSTGHSDLSGGHHVPL